MANGSFENPNPGTRGESPDTEEDAAVSEFEQPSAEQLEPAALSSTAEALAGVSSALLDIKSAIENQLGERVTHGVSSFDARAFEGAGNIQGVGIGLGEAETLTGEPGSPLLHVFVAEHSSQEQVRAVVASVAGVSAAATEEVPLHVEKTGIIDAHPHRFRIRPAPGGMSVGHYKITAGTLGCLATRPQRLLILSNNHVLANSNAAVYGDCISQPGPYDGGKCPADQVAILERFVTINFAGACNYVDAATGWAWTDRVRRELMYRNSAGSDVYFRIGSAPIGPVVGMLVGKTGRTTQLTQGKITAVGATVNVNYGGGKIAKFCDQISVKAATGDFSAGGDSGSVVWVWDAYRRPVGLLFAGGGGTTFCNRMDRVVAALDIALYT